MGQSQSSAIDESSMNRGAPGAHGHMPAVAFRKAQLSARLLKYLAEDGVLQYGSATASDADQTAQFEAAGFRKCVDYGRYPGHIYYEGYFHAMPTSGPHIGSLNPRTGTAMDKPAAPIRLRAFLHAFRRKNTGWIADALGAADSPAGALLRKVWLEERAFSDLAVQVHYGHGIPAEAVGFHTDAHNSLLHMALSLHGGRRLHSMLGLGGEADGDGRGRGRAQSLVVEKQAAGDVYVSSPFAFEHGVEYPRCTFAQRTVAVQCRLLLTHEEVQAMLDRTRPGSYVADGDWKDVLERCISPALLAADLALPTAEEALAAEAELTGAAVPT